MAIFDSMNINTSALNLERTKLDVVSSNIANVNTTRTEEGGPYLRKEVTFEENIKKAQAFANNLGDRKNVDSKMVLTHSRHQIENGRYGNSPAGRSHGVRTTGIVENEENTRLIYDPNHPDADEEGYVEYSNVDMADEMINMMNTVRSYEANVTAMDASKSMLKKALEIANN